MADILKIEGRMRKACLGFLLLLSVVTGSCNRSGLAPDVRTPYPYLYVSMTLGQIAGFSVNPSTGFLTKAPLSPYTLSPVNSLGFNFDGRRNLAWMSSGNNTVYPLAVNVGTGDLSNLGAGVLVNFNLQNRWWGLNPSLGLFYGNDGLSSLYILSYDGNGHLSNTAGSPFAVIGNDLASIIDIFGRFLWMFPNSNVTTYSLSNPVSPNQTQSTGSGVATPILGEDQTGHTVFAADTSGDALALFSINQSTGALTAGTIYFPPVQVDAMVLDSINHFIFVLDNSLPEITTYLVNGNGSSLTKLASTTLSITSVTPIATDPSGKYLYIPTSGNTIYVYSVNQTTGALTQIQGPVSLGGTVANGFMTYATFYR